MAWVLKEALSCDWFRESWEDEDLVESLES